MTKDTISCNSQLLSVNTNKIKTDLKLNNVILISPASSFLSFNKYSYCSY